MTHGLDCAEAANIELTNLDAFRGALLRARSEAQAIAAAVGLLEREVASVVASVEESADTHPGGVVRLPSRVEPTWAIPLGATSHKRLVVRGARLEDAGVLEPLLHAIHAELRESLELIDAWARAGEGTALRAELVRRDALVRHAGEALIRDASEVVRVVAQLEERDSLIREELQQALRFQRAMLGTLPEHVRVSLDALHIAADVISGDFYDVALLGPDSVRIFIADATGHGVAAGLATMFIKSEYEAHKRVSNDPSIVLASMNEMLTSRYKNLELRFTAICLDVHPAAGRVRYAAAAHPGPAIMRASGPEILATGGSFVGLAADVAFPMHEAALAPGDILIAYTDGLVDATAATGAMFGEERILAALKAAHSAGTDPCAMLVRALSDFVGEGRSLTDDVTLVSLTLRA